MVNPKRAHGVASLIFRESPKDQSTNNDGYE
jgi:hypothetical protein